MVKKTGIQKANKEDRAAWQVKAKATRKANAREKVKLRASLENASKEELSRLVDRLDYKVRGLIANDLPKGQKKKILNILVTLRTL